MAKKAKKAKQTDERPIPGIKDEKGRILRLKPKDFPSTDEGKVAYFDYQIARWQDRKDKFARRNDPNAKLARQIESKEKALTKQLAGLDELKAQLAKVRAASK